MDTYLPNLSRSITYVLHVDGQEKWASDTLKEAQDSASEFIANCRPLTIRCWVAPAPNRLWAYDYSTKTWAESV